eukprot:gb/GECH01011767.1/.p1 GENE.gb/GECH01011767.1/~~gb/GECH01011767.1/.p1  ORF type:complete len:795 (+),score=99.00 gb/GECH01011767.1/:1-2385(+)
MLKSRSRQMSCIFGILESVIGSNCFHYNCLNYRNSKMVKKKLLLVLLVLISTCFLINSVSSQENNTSYSSSEDFSAYDGAKTTAQNIRTVLSFLQEIIKGIFKGSGSVRTEFPDDVEDSDQWQKYIMYIVSVGVLGIIIGLILSFLMASCLVLRCCTCGKYKPTKPHYGLFERWLPAVILIVLFVSTFGYIWLGFLYNEKTSEGLVGIFGVADNLGDEMISEVDSFIKSANSLRSKIVEQESKTSDIVNGLDGIVDPISSVQNILSNVGSQIMSINSSITDGQQSRESILEAIENIRGANKDVRTGEPAVDPETIPSSDQIPSISEEDRSTVEDAFNSVKDIRQQVEELEKEVNSSISQARQEVNNNLGSDINNTLSDFDSALDNIVVARDDANKYIDDSKTYINDAEEYDEYRSIVFHCIYAIGLAILALGAIASLLNWDATRKISCFAAVTTVILTFIACFWFFLFFGIMYTGGVAVDEGCDNHLKLLNDSMESFNLEEFDVTDISSLLECSGNTTFGDVITVTDIDIDAKLNSVIEKIENSISNLNSTGRISEARKNVQSFGNIDFNFTREAEFDTVEEQIDELQNFTRNATRFGPDPDEIENRIDDLNDQYDPDPPLTFENIQTRNISDFPPQAQDQIEDIRDQIDLYEEAQTNIEIISSNVTLIETEIQFLESEFDEIKLKTESFSNYSSNINNELDTIEIRSEGIKQSLNSVIRDVKGIITDSNQLLEVGSCGWIGRSYNDLVSYLCTTTSDSLVLQAFTMLMLGIWTFIAFFFSLLGAKKFGRSTVN